MNRGTVISPVVFLHLPNSMQMATMIYGTLCSGLTVNSIPSSSRAITVLALLTDSQGRCFLPRTQLTFSNPALTPTELSQVLSKSLPSVIVTTPEGLARIQDAFELLPASTRAKLGFDKSPRTFVVDTSVDDYGATEHSLGRPRCWESRGWTVQDWKVLLPVDAPSFTPPQKYVGKESSLRAAVIFW